LANFAQHVNEQQLVIHLSALILPSETENAVQFDLAPQGRVQLVGVHEFMVGDLLEGVGVVVDCENEGVLDVSSPETNEDEVLTEFLLLVDAAADHEGAAELGGSVMFETDSAPRPQPLSLLEVEHQQFSIEALALLSIKADPAEEDQMIAVDFDGVEAGGDFGRVAHSLH
jgi:hypothetical protein